MRVASAYQEYRPGKSLEEYADSDRIPLLQMHHLRQLDFRISRRISPERTVDEFLFELAVNDMLRPLRQHKEMVILLDAQGALIRETASGRCCSSPIGVSCRHWMKMPNSGLYFRIFMKRKNKERFVAFRCRIVRYAH